MGSSGKMFRVAGLLFLALAIQDTMAINVKRHFRIAAVFGDNSCSKHAHALTLLQCSVRCTFEGKCNFFNYKPSGGECCISGASHDCANCQTAANPNQEGWTTYVKVDARGPHWLNGRDEDFAYFRGRELIY